MSEERTCQPIKVLLVDDHPSLRAGIRAILEQEEEIAVIAEANDGTTALDAIETLRPTVTVLDCELPDMDGATVAAAVTDRALSTAILALSAFDDKVYIRQMIAAGAKGYLLKSETSDVIVAAIKQIAAGQAFFSTSITTQLASILQNEPPEALTPTPRETDVLQQLSLGKTNSQIANMLAISERTVAYHLENLLNKLGVNNRTEAVVAAIRRGWLEI